MSKEEKKVNRRDFLFTASYTIGAVGVGAVIWPMIDQMNPDKAQQALATTEVDISQVEPGKSITDLRRGKPIFLICVILPQNLGDNTNGLLIKEHIGIKYYIFNKRLQICQILSQ